MNRSLSRTIAKLRSQANSNVSMLRQLRRYADPKDTEYAEVLTNLEGEVAVLLERIDDVERRASE